MLANKPFVTKYFVNGEIIEVLIQPWNKGDPAPKIASRMSEDTETELISVTAMTPKPVVAGFFNPDERIAYMVDWESTDEFYTYLLEKCSRLWGYNTAFDIDTSGTNKIYEALQRDILADVRCNLTMHWFATKGDIRYDCATLAQAADKILHMHLDKGEDKGDESDRLTFRQGVPPTDSQLMYLGGDIVSTFFLGEAYMEYPTLTLQTKADYVLSRITKNGIPVAKDIMKYWRDKVTDEMNTAADKLRAFGFPLKEKEATPKEVWDQLISKIQEKYGLEKAELPIPSKTLMRALLAFVWKSVRDMKNGLFDYDGIDEQVKFLHESTIVPESARSLFATEPATKPNKETYADFLETTGLLPYDSTRKSSVFNLMSCEVLRLYFLEQEQPLAIIDKLQRWGEDNAAKLDAPEQKIGPVTFLQNYLNKLMTDHPGLQFETTPSGKQLKYSKDDAWRLEDAGATSEFLSAYADYKHMEKYLSTYLREEYVWPDGKMHPRFKVMVRSGRTASGGNSKCRWFDGKEVEIPGLNSQNLPSRDGKFLLRNIFEAPEGYAFCCTDYTGSELMSLAQDCYTRYGHSRLRELINAGVDVHYWFAGVIKGLVDPRTFNIKEVDVKELMDMLHANVAKSERSFAKEPVFGLPGGLGVKTFYKRLRVKGFHVTEQETKELIELFKLSFPEMKEHYKADAASGSTVDMYESHRIDEDEEEDLDHDSADRYGYQCTTLTGRKRNRCTYCSAVNGRFQGFSADVIKYALWNLYEAGFGPYIVNEVHDEADLVLPLDKVREWVPMVEHIMFQSAQTMLPDIQVSGETTVSLLWDKGGTPFNELEYDKDGKPILELPEYIRELRNQATRG